MARSGSILACFLWSSSLQTVKTGHKNDQMQAFSAYFTFLSPFHSLDLFCALQLHLSTFSCNCFVCWTLIAPHRTWTHMVNFLPQLLCILGCNCSLQNLSPHAQFPYQLSSPHCLQGTMANAAHRGICTCDYCHFPLELSQEKHYSRVPFK